MDTLRTSFGAAAVLMALLGCGRPERAAPATAGDVSRAPGADASAPAAAPAHAVSPAVQAALAARGRSEADRALDAGRRSGELLSFFGIAPGMRVAELGAGGGYTAELLARVVGARGRVYAQNSRVLLERFAEKPFSERLKKPSLSNVARVEREFDDPLPPDAKELDAVLLVLFYHDTVWLGTDRAAMNRAIFTALKPGGVYGLVDHSARSGDGVSVAQSLHRIEEGVVRSEIERAGFVLDAESSLLREPGDARDWNASPSAAGERRGTSDRFVLRYRKPR
jgi:predicted methyltransferase